MPACNPEPYLFHAENDWSGRHLHSRANELAGDIHLQYLSLFSLFPHHSMTQQPLLHLLQARFPCHPLCAGRPNTPHWLATHPWALLLSLISLCSPQLLSLLSLLLPISSKYLCSGVLEPGKAYQTQLAASLCTVSFALERKIQLGEHPKTLLKSPPLNCSPRVLQNLAAPGTPGVVERLGQAVIEKLTEVNLSIQMIPGKSFPPGWTWH